MFYENCHRIPPGGRGASPWKKKARPRKINRKKKGEIDMVRKCAKWSLCLMFVLLLCAVTSVSAVEGRSHDLQAKVAAGQLVQKVDAFAVIFDSTLSMNEIYKNNTKLNQEKALVLLFNETIPNLQLTAAAREFGQFTFFGDATSRSLFGPVNYTKSALPQAIAPIKMGKGFSPLDAGIDGVSADLRSQPGRIAVIAFSDGEDMEKFTPVDSAKRMKAAYGDRICIYTVHLGDNAGGRKLLQDVADASQCGFMVTGESVSNPAGMAAFVEKVFLEPKKEPAIAIAPPPPPPPPMEEMKKEAEAATEVEKAIVEKGRATLLVEFDFDKAVVKPKYDQEIEKLANVMKKYPDLDIVVEGHTDNIGTKQYNERLSQRRADAIREVMVKKFGIDAARIKAKGYGLSNPIASNATKAGRQQNRRVEAAVEYTKQK
jgi:OOP family OmpA-OmpF porin